MNNENSISEYALQKMLYFFDQEKNFRYLSLALNRKNKITLRLLEHTLENIDVLMNNPKTHGLFLLNLSNRGKTFFDSFRRHGRFVVKRNQEIIETNLGQLRFIYVCIKNNIFKYLDNPDNFEKASQSLKRKIAQNRNKKSKKRFLKRVYCTIK